MARLRESLETERTRSANLSITLDREREEKDSTLLRNAEVNQQVELARQELREQEQESVELHNKLAELEKKVSEKDKVKLFNCIYMGVLLPLGIFFFLLLSNSLILVSKVIPIIRYEGM